MLHIEITKTYDATSQEWASSVYTKLYVSFFTSGLMAQLGDKRAMTLLAIASFMDESGECYPTQEKIAQRLGITRQNANTRINSLLAFRWNDRPIIERVKIRNPRVSPNEFSVYTILPLAQVAKFQGEIENISDAPGAENAAPKKATRTDSRRELLGRFSGKYREVYGARPNISGARDMVHLGNLLKTYDKDTAAQIIDVAIEEYDSRWATKDYPRPTLGQVATWLAPKAVDVIHEREKQAERYNEPENAGYDMGVILAALGGGAL